MLPRTLSRARATTVSAQSHRPPSSGPAARPGIFEPLEPRRLLAGAFEFFTGDYGARVVVEAEQFDTNTPRGSHSWEPVSGGVDGAMQVLPDIGAGITGDFNATAPRLDYAINFPSGGTYGIWVRGKAVAGKIGNSDSLHVGLNGVVQANTDKITSFGDDWTWSANTMDDTGFQVETTFSVPSAGVHTINLYMREDGFTVDRFFIAQVTGQNFPMGPGPRASERAPGGSTTDPATIAGSLANPDPLSGPVDVRFNGLNLQNVHPGRAILPLPDGRFYLIGGSGALRQHEWTAAYVTRHNADGSIDRTFGDDGRRALAADSPLLTTEMHPQSGGGFLYRSGADRLRRLTSDLLPDSTFGTNGELVAPTFAVRPNGGVLTLVTGDGNAVWRRFDAAGDFESMTTTADPRTGRTDPDGAAYTFIDNLFVVDDGSVRLVVSNFNYTGFMRISSSLSVDTSYGGDGVADKQEIDSDTFGNAMEVSGDGRVFMSEEDADGPNYMTLLSASGQFTAKNVMYFPGTFTPWTTVDDVSARFHDDGDVSVVYGIRMQNHAGAPADQSRAGFGVDRFNANGTHDSAFKSFDLWVPEFGDETLAGADTALLADGTFTIAANASGDVLLWRVSTGRDVAPTAIVDFEEAAVGKIASGIYTEDGFTFSDRPGSGGSALEPLIVHGPQQGYASKVLSTTSWARRIDVEKDGGGSFDLASFDYAAGRWGEAGDFTVTGQLAGGGTVSRTASFSSKQLTTLDLDWTGLSLVSINFSGGANSAYGAVDNFVFGAGGEEDTGRAEISGFISGADPIGGPARLSFDNQHFHDTRELLPLPDGRFYIRGTSSTDPYSYPFPATGSTPRVEGGSVREYYTRHLADGSIDRTFGDDGRVDDLAYLDGKQMYPLPTGGFLATWFSAGDGVFFERYDNQLQPVASFGGGDNLASQAASQAAAHVVGLPDGGFIAAIGSGLFRYDSAGAQVDSFSLSEIPASETLVTRSDIRSVGVDGAARVYLAYSESDDYHDDREYIVILARLTPAMVLDTTYGHQGTYRHSQLDGFVYDTLISRDVFVGDDGRALVEFENDDGDTFFNLVTPQGQHQSHFTGFRGSGEHDVTAAQFAAGGQVAVAFHVGGNLVIDEHVDDEFSRTKFGVVRLINGAYDASFNNDGPIGVTVGYSPSEVRSYDSFAHPDGSFVFGGYHEIVSFSGTGDNRAVTDVDHVAGLWRIDPGDGQQQTLAVDFELASVGQIASGLYTEDGFTFSNRPGAGGSTLEPLVVHGPQQGYASKVLSTVNWARRIDVTRDGAAGFGLSSFDYAAGRWGEAGDLVVTGFFAGGGSETRTVAFNSKSLSTLSLNWQNLTGLSINFAGGANSAYGAVDNFQFVV